ncbi:MAG: hypothetical protein ACXU9X_10275 [Thermodesulfobacteriota bacterium]
MIRKRINQPTVSTFAICIINFGLMEPQNVVIGDVRLFKSLTIDSEPY